MTFRDRLLGTCSCSSRCAPIDDIVVERAKISFAVNVRALDAIHVTTAEVLAVEAGEPLEFWTHDDRQAIAPLSRGLPVRGVESGNQ